MSNSAIRTVELRVLVPDGCNFKDAAFSEFVSQFMQRLMPGFPLDLLDTDSEIAWERWEVEADALHFPERVSWTLWTCDGCGEETTETPNAVCCLNEHRDDETPEKWVPETQVGWVLRNENTSQLVGEDTAYTQNISPYQDGDLDVLGESGVWVWHKKSEAEEAAANADILYHQEHGHESSYGFPWANSWCYLPDDRITDEDLKAAGFTVAQYTGGKGDTREDAQYRLCGLDSGGYSFKGQHFAKLTALVHERLQWFVDTDNGKALITTDYRADVEKLADVAEEEVACG